MRAAIYDRRGTSEVLRVTDVPTPGPGVGEVRVRLQVAAVNPTDWKSRTGSGELAFPFQVPGQDGAGIIEAVGPGVDLARIGERVWVYHAAWQRQWGTAAQFTVVPARQAIPLAAGVDIDLAASLGIPFITAFGCLYSDGPIDGKTVLVHGGAGAVGNAAIQLARRGGAHVIATVSSPAKADLAEAAGAHVIINYRDSDAVEQVKAAARAGVDRVIEVNLTDNLDLDLAVLTSQGVIVTYAADRPDPTIPVRKLMFGNTVLRFAIVYSFTQSMLDAATSEISAALEEGALTPLPFLRYSLDQISAAHDAVEGRAVGKVLIDLPV